MANEREARLAELVKSAVELGPDGWAAFLDRECQSDRALRAEVESLLGHQEHARDFIEEPALHFAAETLVREGAFATGHIIGDYKILSLIGRGGMGEVYLAKDLVLQRKAALKFVRRGMDSDDVIRRFKHEERLLASLNHSNIAQLYGSGVTDGIPFFAMEFVEGKRLDQYCNERQLSIGKRLQLFQKICAAVQYAHQHLVIHRDLKPSNVLVTDTGEPKLVDFGIAKLLETEDLPATLAPTLSGVMTPDYASPEQVRGEAITTGSDVYSLGVILYELLTGCRPYQTKTRRPDEVARAVIEQEPTRPSTAAASNRESAIENRKSLRGDLDNIVLMALRKDHERRYSSVAQFAADIARHLEGLPVLARKDTLAYRTTKFAQRNKVGVTAAALVLLTLVGGIIATTSQARRALREARVAAEQRDRARKEAVKAARITTFLQNVLGFSDPTWLSPNPQGNREATIADALDQGGRRAANELADEPEVLAAVHFTIGWTYKAQGKFDSAEPHLRASLDLRRRVLGAGAQETAQSLIGLGEFYFFKGKLAEAGAAFREAIEIYRRAKDRGNVDSKWFAISLNDLATVQGSLGDPTSAESSLREALDVGRDLTGSERTGLAVMMGNLGVMRRERGDLDGSIALLDQALEEYRHLPGDPRFEKGTALSNLATAFMLKGEYDRAEPLAREAFDLLRNSVGEKHPYPARPLITLGHIAYGRGDYPKAKEEIARALDLQHRGIPEGHIEFGNSWVALGKILTRTGETTEAESYLRKALDLRTRALPAGHHLIADAHGALGDCLTSQTRFSEAEPLLCESYKILETRLGPKDPRTQEARQRLLTLYQAWDKPDEAARYR